MSAAFLLKASMPHRDYRGYYTDGHYTWSSEEEVPDWDRWDRWHPSEEGPLMVVIGSLPPKGRGQRLQRPPRKRRQLAVLPPARGRMRTAYPQALSARSAAILFVAAGGP